VRNRRALWRFPWLLASLGCRSLSKLKPLKRRMGKRRLGIVPREHTDEDGATIFREAGKLGHEGIVSERLRLPTTRLGIGSGQTRTAGDNSSKAKRGLALRDAS
jgi:hypothetical protein